MLRRAATHRDARSQAAAPPVVGRPQGRLARAAASPGVRISTPRLRRLVGWLLIFIPVLIVPAVVACLVAWLVMGQTLPPVAKAAAPKSACSGGYAEFRANRVGRVQAHSPRGIFLSPRKSASSMEREPLPSGFVRCLVGVFRYPSEAALRSFV